MPLTNYGQQQLVAYPFGKGSAPTTISTFNVGLVAVDFVWAPSTLISSAQVSAGYYCIGTKFNTSNGSPVRAVFKCITAGTTNSAAQGEPTWVTTAGGTTTETNGVQWQECTNQFFNTTAGVFSGPEVGAGAGYSRQTITNSQSGSTWSTPSIVTAPTAYTTSVTYQATSIGFGTSSTSWKVIAGYILTDSATIGAGNCYAYGLLNSYLTVYSSGITVSIPNTNPITVSLT